MGLDQYIYKVTEQDFTRKKNLLILEKQILYRVILRENITLKI